MEEACSAFGITAIEDPAKEQGLFDRSDNVNFAKKGVPLMRKLVNIITSQEIMQII